MRDVWDCVGKESPFANQAMCKTAYAACGCDSAICVRRLISPTQVATFSRTYFSLKVSAPIAAYCLLLLLTHWNHRKLFEPGHNLFFAISQVFRALGWYPYFGPDDPTIV